MLISLDTNVWIFGLLKSNLYCQKILFNLPYFQIIIPNQIRVELIRNLPEPYIEEFYQLINESTTQFNYEQVPETYLAMFQRKGLKKGDAIIGGFCEWKKVDSIVSNNRDFLRSLTKEGNYFAVLSPQEFCNKFGL
jgi:predicted nucleic acid-binding protein